MKRYATVTAPWHPLADSCGRAYVHRVTLFDAIGPGDSQCHWCGVHISWLPREGIKRLVVDHLDGERLNNSLGNLVPSCSGCNSLRGGHAKSRKTHCPRGHEYTPENTYFRRDKNGCRRCRTCCRLGVG